MPGGRPRKSAAAKMLEGARRKIGKRKLAAMVEAEASFATPGRPSVPVGVKLGPAGKAFWSEVIEELDTRGRLVKTDKFALSSAALAFQAQAEAYEEGDSARAAKLASVVRSFLCEYGLTESSRARLAAQKAPRGEETLEDLLSAGVTPGHDGATLQ